MVFISIIFQPHIQVVSYSIYLFWLTSISLIPSRYIHIASNGKISIFLWLSNIPLAMCFSVCVYHIFFIHSSVDGHLGCFHILAIIYNANINTDGEGNGNPLQYSCLENPMDRGAWWAAIYGVAQSQPRLKRLSSSSMNTEHVFFQISVFGVFWTYI